MGTNGIRVPWLHLQTHMIYVRGAVIRRLSPLSTEFAFGINEVNQRMASSQLGEFSLARPSFKSAAKNLTVEGDHWLQVPHPDYDVIDTTNIKWVCNRHGVFQ
jgi:hypothetical protein